MALPNPAPLRGRILPGGATAEAQPPQQTSRAQLHNSGVVQVTLGLWLQTQHQGQEHRAVVKTGDGICVQEPRPFQELSAELHGHLAAAFPTDPNGDAVQPGQGRATLTWPCACTLTAGCRSGEWMMIRLRRTSCCTRPRMTRLPRHRPRPLVGCRKAHTPSCSTTGERQSFKHPEHMVLSSQSAPQPPPDTAASSALAGSCET